MRRLLAAVAMVCCAGGMLPARAADLMASVRARAWSDADAAAATYADPVVRKLVLFYRLLTPQAGSMAELDKFLAANPDWPLQGGLARRREEALAAEPDDPAVIASCGNVRPASAPALARCAQAELRQGHPEAASDFARLAWVAANPDPAWEADFLLGWGPEIGPAQNWQRFERLAWTDPAEAAKTVERLAPDDRLAAQAWLALRHDDPHAGDLAAAIPMALRAIPLLVLERLRWLRRTGHDTDALALWASVGTPAERLATAHQPAFWDERNVLARRRLRDDDAAGAYALSADAVQTAPEQRADAAFLAGWIALRKLGDPTDARRHFTELTRASAAILTESRGQYWIGRAALAQGDAAAAKQAFAVASGFVTTFYGQLAAGGEATLMARIDAASDPAWQPAQAEAFVGRELSRAALWLVAWGEPGRAASFLLRLPETAHDAASFSLAAHLAAGFDMPELAVALARRAGRVGVMLPQAGWPVAADIPARAPVEPSLALAVIRQESSFDPATISPVGARGLMQLMPATALQVARPLGVEAPAAALTADPALNIRLGTDYLRTMLDRFAGAVPLAVAAYNAGPSRVSEWLKNNGDPRTGTPEMIDWIELIPFGETRNYVQRVIENAVVYQARLGAKSESPLGKWPRSPA